MSRNAVGVTLAIYLLVSLAFGLFYQLAKVPSYSGIHAGRRLFSINLDQPVAERGLLFL